MKKSYDELKKQLIDCIASCPIVYVNHYHYSLIDKVIKDIISLPTLKLNNDCVLEFDEGNGKIVDFDTKQIDISINFQPVSIKDLLQYIVYPSLTNPKKNNERPWHDNKRIYL